LIISEWLNPNLTFHLFLCCIDIPSYRDLTNPNTILQFILVIIFIFVISKIPGNCFHIEVSWLMICCVQWVHLRKCRWTDLIKLRFASSVHESNFVIIEHERDVERKGIRILCFIICLHSFNTMYFGKSFAFKFSLTFCLVYLICPIFINRYSKWNFWLTCLILLSYK